MPPQRRKVVEEAQSKIVADRSPSRGGRQDLPLTRRRRRGRRRPGRVTSAAETFRLPRARRRGRSAATRRRARARPRRSTRSRDGRASRARRGARRGPRRSPRPSSSRCAPRSSRLRPASPPARGDRRDRRGAAPSSSPCSSPRRSLPPRSTRIRELAARRRAARFAGSSSSDDVVLEVNPADFDAGAGVDRRSLEPSAGGFGSIEVSGERRVGRGGCIVRTAEGEIDARIESQLARAARSAPRSFSPRERPRSSKAPSDALDDADLCRAAAASRP